MTEIHRGVPSNLDLCAPLGKSEMMIAAKSSFCAEYELGTDWKNGDLRIPVG